MKKTLLLLMVSFIATVAFAQGEKEAIRKAVNDYFVAVEKNDLEKILDDLPEQFFEVIPREDLKKQFEETFNDEDVKIKIFNNKIINISDLVSHEGNKYSKIDYSFAMSMIMKIDEEDAMEPEDEEDMDVLGFTLKMLKGQFGEENVTLNRERKEFMITSTKEMYAIMEPGRSSKWKFIGKEPGMESILYKIVPMEVVTKLD